MAFRSFHDFVEQLDRAGELQRITEEVDTELVIAEWANREMKLPGGGKALLFEKPMIDGKTSAFPVAINTMGSRKRIAMALGVNDVADLAQEIQLILKCWPKDGGRFITFPNVHTSDPESGARNVGMYRMQVFDERTTAMHWQVHKVGARHGKVYYQRGERMPVAVTLGGDPALTFAATAPLPDGLDEILFAGFVRKKSVELVKCKTIEVEVPADADFVLEGFVQPGEMRPEGPFGDHTGFYTAIEDYPVFHLTAITHRRDAIYSTTIVGPPPMEDFYMGDATVRIFLPVFKMNFPEMVDMTLPPEGVFHNLVFVSIR